ncbi:response regulator transcription factor [Mucilaginibacter auburnensis]|uniref:Response regulator receiver domain-containing protein n=1 Tax=Mucilaginibacter auburnensis TaxID=1457233 RepID=A0A2H9VR81_9SPHI|nr:response regulator [Mucilaginibacter auburnensis]PJJ83337.1 response regulator receiver domain-containing protein [Mucilaginibacter auburnensis]
MAKRILVIDDNEDILELVRMIFQEEGYDVIISNTSETAEHILFLGLDLIVLDVRLENPYKTGADICREFKTQHPEVKTPVILLSAEPDLHLVASSCGADGYLSKPFDVDALLNYVAALVA